MSTCRQLIMMKNGTANGVGMLSLIMFLLIAVSIAYPSEKEESSFDYSDYAAVLKEHVDDNGLVTYSKLNKNPEKLEAYLKALGTLTHHEFNTWNKNEKLAFWINAYNGLTLKAIIDHYPIKSSFIKSFYYPKNSIRQISGVWDKLKFKVMGKPMTLDHIEHGIIRKQFDEPRIHFALVCAAKGCPILLNEPYLGSMLEEQLDSQSQRFLSNPEKFKIDKEGNIVYLSSIFKWYGADFESQFYDPIKFEYLDKTYASILNFALSYLNESDKDYLLNHEVSIKFLEYDWELNER